MTLEPNTMTTTKDQADTHNEEIIHGDIQSTINRGASYNNFLSAHNYSYQRNQSEDNLIPSAENPYPYERRTGRVSPSGPRPLPSKLTAQSSNPIPWAQPVIINQDTNKLVSTDNNESLVPSLTSTPSSSSQSLPSQESSNSKGKRPKPTPPPHKHMATQVSTENMNQGGHPSSRYSKTLSTLGPNFIGFEDFKLEPLDPPEPITTNDVPKISHEDTLDSIPATISDMSSLPTISSLNGDMHKMEEVLPGRMFYVSSEWSQTATTLPEETFMDSGIELPPPLPVTLKPDDPTPNKNAIPVSFRDSHVATKKEETRSEVKKEGKNSVEGDDNGYKSNNGNKSNHRYKINNMSGNYSQLAVAPSPTRDVGAMQLRQKKERLAKLQAQIQELMETGRNREQILQERLAEVNRLRREKELRSQQINEMERNLSASGSGTYSVGLNGGLENKLELLRRLVSLVIIEERVLGRLRRFGKCEEVWKAEEAQKNEDLITRLKGVQNVKVGVATQAWEFALDKNIKMDELHIARDTETQLQGKADELQTRISGLEQKIEQQKGDKDGLEAKWKQLSDVSMVQKRQLDAQLQTVILARKKLEDRTEMWEKKAQELGDRLDAFDKVRDIKESLTMLTHPTDWNTINPVDKDLTSIKFCRPFDLDEEAQRDISEFMRDITVVDDAFVSSTESKSFRIETRGPINAGGFRSVFLLNDGTSDYVGKVFHLRRGEEKDKDCAMRTIKSGLLANEAARAFTMELQKALENKDIDEQWSLEYIPTWLLLDYDDPFPDPNEVPKKTVMMLEPSLNKGDISFEKFTGAFGEFQPIPSAKDPSAPRGNISLVAVAFSHWSYVASDRRFMVVDVQGAFNEKEHKFYLTDPGIHTEDQAFWDALNHDCDGNYRRGGTEGFKRTHRCNSYCKYLGIDDRW